ncbi:helix-turn-helix domain-containing protein [Domibacillus indicus]|uniref:response regulator transcription factor n=1 Tax=Domibacillus indicus TaxID=1437523 RepID=UPI00203C347C|nr:response regulator transcription factor [Domibacillus indicus]MCM3790023.1 helix-turn-helix domain-containing protein [Domibacillus indicus]
MEIHLVAKNQLEANGIRWVLESHFTGIQLHIWDTIETFEEGVQKQQPDLVILDMDGWQHENEKFNSIRKRLGIKWIGISSERIFQTAYSALRFRAEDVLFRPFLPTDLIKLIQQLRYQMRNKKLSYSNSITREAEVFDIDYPDLFLKDKRHTNSISMIAFLTPSSETLYLVHDALQRHSFTGNKRILVFSDFILCVQETKEEALIKEEYQTFLTRWKEHIDEPLAIVIKIAPAGHSLKDIYEQTRQLTRRIFFEGYDIILAEEEEVYYREIDPFLTPLEQRQWIEMLEKRDINAIRSWIENEFLTFQPPYPDPEIIRIRLTSVLAQIRRYIKSYDLQSTSWEAIYHKVFQYIVQNPVIYQIVQELLVFTTRLLQQNNTHLNEEPRSLVEKARELIESNYWDAQWNLTACANALRVNKSTLSRRFATESSQSFRDTLHQMRIGEAKKLLQETDLPLEEIARLTGYSHQTYFNSKFKLLEGCTPLVYRQKL